MATSNASHDGLTKVVSLKDRKEHLSDKVVPSSFWTGMRIGAITRRAHQSSRCEYGYLVMLHADGSTQIIELPLESYSTKAPLLGRGY